METTDLIAKAAAGDHDAFRALVEPHSHELQVHCYRILGSLQDAEDALQETLVSAWRSLGEFGRRSSIRTWLYQIATNRCLSMLRADSRRPRIATARPEPALPDPAGSGDAPPWLEPYPDVLLDHLVDQRPGRRRATRAARPSHWPSSRPCNCCRRGSARRWCCAMCWDTARPKWRGCLRRRRSRCRSALKRARATVDSHLADSAGGDGKPVRQPDTAVEQRLVARFTDALERSDLDALIELLVTDVRLSMPPVMLEYQGIESARRLFTAVVFRPGRAYRVVPTRANGQPAFGLYMADPRAGVYRAYSLLVITTAGDQITVITGFHNTEIMTRFGMPRTLPDAC